MSADIRQQIATSLRSCGDDLSRGKLHDQERKKGRLRVLQDELRNAVRLQGDDEMRAAAFMLSVWIDRYYFNLSGTFPSTLSEKAGAIRRRFLMEVVGPTLTTLGQSIAGGEGVVAAPYVRLLAAYLDAVSEVGRIAEAESA